MMKKILFLVLLTAGLGITPRTPQAAPHIEVNVLDARPGVAKIFKQCPCVRATLQIRTLGGSWETREFLISSDALYRFYETAESFERVRDFATRVHEIGAVDVLWKTGHVGVGFKGIQWGNEPELGYTDIIRTGFYGTINVLLSKHFRLDIRSGYDVDKFRLNLAPATTNTKLTQSLLFSWKSKYFESYVTASFSPQEVTDFAFDGAHIRAAAGLEVKPLQWKDIKLALGARATADRDPFREIYGMVRDRGVAEVYISARWEPGNRWD